MPTFKKRISISLPRNVARDLEKLAKRDDIPTATKALTLLRLAMSIDEDDVLNRFAEERDTAKAQFISHEEVWK